MNAKVTFVPKLLSAACLLLMAFTLIAADEPIDRTKLRELYQRSQRGEKLTPDEQSYLDRGRREMQKRNGGGFDKQREEAMKKLGPPRESTGLIPLTEMGQEKYKGEDGGLYGGGNNKPPAPHAAAANKLSQQIQPLDTEGKPAKNGKIGVLSVGMSNTTMEYSAFQRLANEDAEKSPSVVLVDGAQGGKTARIWADPDAPVWGEVDNRMKRAGVTPEQIQVAWMKQAEAGPASYGDFPAHALNLKSNLVVCLNHLHKKFPNLKIVYLSSRIYAGYATTPLNPEPYSYESAFTMRWLIQDQIAGKPELNYDAAKGEVKSPLLLWGPYIWADGMKPRKSDGLIWEKKDLSDRDGTHPSDPSGRQKVAKMLLQFFKTDPTAKTWFTTKSANAQNK